MKLAGRNALITGANQGLGCAIARAYLEAGASVLLCARNAALLKEAQSELEAIAQPGQQVLAQPADVSKADQTEALVQAALDAFGRLDILVNNAGIYGPKGLLEEVDWTEWTQAIEINLYGTILMCRVALPHFKANGYGKIINLSGGGATNPLPRLSAYAASKAAVVRMTETLSEEVQGSGIDVNAVAPGALNTRLLDEVLAAGPEKVGQAFYERMLKLKAEGGTPLEKGAALCVYLASAASDGITGKLISAVWDPWADLAAYRAELNHSDIYTLRRIVPEDRGQKWD
jgi:NAD(P)-dependent dehydrogenase (short-subunit alcohol dehydrogenase family)